MTSETTYQFPIPSLGHVAITLSDGTAPLKGSSIHDVDIEGAGE